MTIIKLMRDLLDRIGSADEKVIVRIVTRDKQDKVVKAAHAPVSYLKCIDGLTTSIAIEADQLKEVPIEYEGE